MSVVLKNAGRGRRDVLLFLTTMELSLSALKGNEEHGKLIGLPTSLSMDLSTIQACVFVIHVTTRPAVILIIFG